MVPRSWQDELEIIDRTMRAISGVTDPEELVDLYWDGVGELMPIVNYVSVSRRNVDPPGYIITRSSRFTEHFNPWTQRDRLPRCAGGILGEVAYADRPVIIEDLPARLRDDDPGHFYLHGFETLLALPHYDNGVGLNVTSVLLPPGANFDFARLPQMHWHSSLFGRGTQNLVLRNQLSAALGELDRELQVVGEIQKSLLPKELPVIDGFELAAFYQTSARAGGDYYDFFPLSDGQWGIFIADVSGHGTPAAVLMAITHAIAHARPGTHTPPSDLVTYLNHQLARSYTRGGTFITAFYGVIDPVARTITYAAAGHPPPRLAREGRIISLEGAAGLPMGIVGDESYAQATCKLEAGDLLLLYTDGITEAMAPPHTGSRDLFGADRLDRVLLDCPSADADQCLARVRDAVAAFSTNAPAADDQTLIAVRVRST